MAKLNKEMLGENYALREGMLLKYKIPKKNANMADIMRVLVGLSILKFKETDRSMKLIDINTKKNNNLMVIPKKFENISPLSLVFFKSKSGIYNLIILYI